MCLSFSSKSPCAQITDFYVSYMCYALDYYYYSWYEPPSNSNVMGSWATAPSNSCTTGEHGSWSKMSFSSGSNLGCWKNYKSAQPFMIWEFKCYNHFDFSRPSMGNSFFDCFQPHAKWSNFSNGHNIDGIRIVFGNARDGSDWKNRIHVADHNIVERWL